MTRDEIFQEMLRGLIEITEGNYVADSLNQWRQQYGERGLYSIDFGAVDLDSLAQLEVIGHLERALDIRIPNDDILRMSSFGHLLDLIEQKLAAKATPCAPPPA